MDVAVLDVRSDAGGVSWLISVIDADNRCRGKTPAFVIVAAQEFR